MKLNTDSGVTLNLIFRTISETNFIFPLDLVVNYTLLQTSSHTSSKWIWKHGISHQSQPYYFTQSGFPLLQTDKIPWLFPDFSSIFCHFPVFFNALFFQLKTWSILANNTQFISISLKISIIFISSFPVFCVIFPDFSSLLKIPWLFPDWKMPSHFFRFSRFSSPSGNPDNGKDSINFNFKKNKSGNVLNLNWCKQFC